MEYFSNNLQVYFALKGQNTLVSYSKNVPKLLVINMAFYCWLISHLSKRQHACMPLRFITIKCHVNYQYFWNIFGITYKCILHFKAKIHLKVFPKLFPTYSAFYCSTKSAIGRCNNSRRFTWMGSSRISLEQRDARWAGLSTLL